MKIVLTGGGTGGHLMPLIAVARKLKEKAPGIDLFFLGPNGEMEKKLIGQEGIVRKNILSGKMRRYFSLYNLVDFFKIPLGIAQALWHLFWLMPDAIFSKGGYASLPVVLAGWLYRIPIMIHESDASPGLANSMLAKFSDRVAVSYPQAEDFFPAKQVVLTGNPLRMDLMDGDPQKARQKFSLTDSKKVIFVWGGSQGAQVINEQILDILPQLLSEFQVIHQTGEKNYEATKEKAGRLGIKAGREGYFPLPFIGEELKDILSLADLVISRAGSNSISEIAAYAKPAILIPLETAANNHQRKNAYSIAKTGGAIVLEESNLGDHLFLATIKKILENDELREKLAKNIKTFYHPNATEKITDGILGMVQK